MQFAENHNNISCTPCLTLNQGSMHSFVVTGVSLVFSYIFLSIVVPILPNFFSPLFDAVSIATLLRTSALHSLRHKLCERQFLFIKFSADRLIFISSMMSCESHCLSQWSNRFRRADHTFEIVAILVVLAFFLGRVSFFYFRFDQHPRQWWDRFVLRCSPNKRACVTARIRVSKCFRLLYFDGIFIDKKGCLVTVVAISQLCNFLRDECKQGVKVMSVACNRQYLCEQEMTDGSELKNKF